MPVSHSSDRMKLDAIIALAQGNLVAAAANTPPQAASASPAGESSRSESRQPEEDESRRKRQKTVTWEVPGPGFVEEEDAKKEKRMAKMVGDVVVRSMSKYKEMMDHETFKRYAKEVSPNHMLRIAGEADPTVHDDFGGKGEKRIIIHGALTLAASNGG